MFNSKDVTKMVGIADSTLRRYIKIFPSAFSRNAKRARNRRYSDQDLAVVAKIRDLFSDGYREDDIRRQLDSIIDDQPPPPEFESSLAIIPKMDKAIQDTRKDIKGIHDRLDSYAERMDRLESEWREYQRLSWWRKLITRKPPTPFD